MTAVKLLNFPINDMISKISKINHLPYTYCSCSAGMMIWFVFKQQLRWKVKVKKIIKATIFTDISLNFPFALSITAISRSGSSSSSSSSRYKNREAYACLSDLNDLCLKIV
uniref:Uncharacterized protein n=1 Tax=Glossina pallidipes TaxID=7398 RepID=A0A1A9Z1S6_GLOPL